MMDATNHAQENAKKSVSELLGELELRGRDWCYVDMGPKGGFSVPASDSLFFHAVLHGSVYLSGAMGGTLELRSGDLALVLSGEAHAIRCDATNSASLLDFFRIEQNTDIPPTIPVSVHGPVQARTLSGRLTARWPNGLDGSKFRSFIQVDSSSGASLLMPDALHRAGIGSGASALLTRLASMALVAALRHDFQSLKAFRGHMRDPIKNALRLISADPARNWTVEKLARSVGMGRSSFAACFAQQTGRSPVQVLTETRMEFAFKLLRGNSFRIADVSEMAGYSCAEAFSRRFTKHFGVSPGKVREEAKQHDSTQRTGQPVRVLSSTLRFASAKDAVGCGTSLTEAATPNELEIDISVPQPKRPLKFSTFF